MATDNVTPLIDRPTESPNMGTSTSCRSVPLRMARTTNTNQSTIAFKSVVIMTTRVKPNCFACQRETLNAIAGKLGTRLF